MKHLLSPYKNYGANAHAKYLVHHRRYNSLRLPGHDYSNQNQWNFITLCTRERSPVFADPALARMILQAWLDSRTVARLRIHVYTLMPDHLHTIVQPRTGNETLDRIIGSLKGITTQTYWKRATEVFDGAQIERPGSGYCSSMIGEMKPILQALGDWRAALRPEVVRLENWPVVTRKQYLKKRLWHESFFDHVIRNEEDFENTVAYIVNNPVGAGFVKEPYYYPYTGFLWGQ